VHGPQLGRFVVLTISLGFQVLWTTSAPACPLGWVSAGEGLVRADAEPWPHLRLELWLEKRDPLSCPIPVHVKGRVPRRFPTRLRWCLQPEWTLAERLQPVVANYDETPCYRCARVQIHFGTAWQAAA
jgi:hypothetical protein